MNTKQENRDIEEREMEEEKLYKFLKEILGKIMGQQDVKLILQKGGYKIFRKAFTHKSVDINENYEVLELLGDSKLESAFNDYLYHKFPEVTSPAVFTTLITYYLSKNKLAELSDKLGLSKFIITNESSISTTDKEDIFEAFIGALSVAADTMIQRHMGNVFVSEFVTKVYDQENIDVTAYEKYKTYVSILKEIYDSKGWGQVTYTQNVVPNYGYYVSVVKDDITIGNASDKTAKKAKEKAAEQAINYLKGQGVIKSTSKDIIPEPSKPKSTYTKPKELDQSRPQQKFTQSKSREFDQYKSREFDQYKSRDYNQYKTKDSDQSKRDFSKSKNTYQIDYTQSKKTSDDRNPPFGRTLRTRD